MKRLKREIDEDMKKDNVHQEYRVPDLEESMDQQTKGVLNESQEQGLEDVVETIENDIANTFEEDTNQKIQDLTQQKKELLKRVEGLEAENQRTRRKSQDLEGIALLAEAAKDL